MRLSILAATLSMASAQLKWCVDNNLAACNEAAAILRAQDTNPLNVECVQPPEGAESCVNYLKNDVFEPFADFTRANGVNQHMSFRRHGLKAVVSEDDNGAFVSGYTAIAVVRTNDNTINQLSDLRGKNACMTAYGRTSGWQFPVGNLINSGIMEVVAARPNEPNDEESVEVFFNNVCAPGSPGQRLCSACHDTCSNGNFPVGVPADRYEGYDGAYLGLQEGACDVAFTKYQGYYDSSQYSILGPSGKCPLLDYNEDRCNLGKNSAPVIVLDPERHDTNSQDLIRQAFLTASSNPEFITIVREGGVFGSSLHSLVTIRPELTLQAHMGQAFDNYEGTRKARYPARWCYTDVDFGTISESSRCRDVTNVLNQKEAELDGAYDYEWSCAGPYEDKGACVEAINEGLAEFTTLGVADERLEDRGHALFDAFYESDMRAVMEEDYGDWHGDSYMAVALVKKSSGITSLSQLEGKKLCSTGYGNNAGWDMPLGALLNANVIQPIAGDGTVPNDILTIQNHFSSVCAPRQSETDTGICDLCPEHCAPASLTLDRYQGFKGAFRCLVDANGPGGDVAFVEGQTVYKFASDGTDPKSWTNGAIEDFRLLCIDGTYLDVNSYTAGRPWEANYFRCNLGRLPAAAVATGTHVTHSQFVAAQAAMMQADSDPSFRNQYLVNSNGLIFSADTYFLLPVEAGTQAYFGEAHSLFQAVEDLNNMPRTGSGSGGSSSGISSGEATGLAFAMMGVGVGLTFLAGYGIKHYRMAKQGADMSQSSAFTGTLLDDAGGAAPKPDQI